MSENYFRTKIDIKHKKMGWSPRIVQYDKVRLEFEVLDNMSPYDLTPFVRVEFTHKRPNKTTVKYPGSFVTINNVKMVRYDYVGSEMDWVGNVETSFSLFDSNNKKVSVPSFVVKVDKDLLEDAAAVEPNRGIVRQLADDLEEIKEMGGVPGVQGPKGDPGNPGPTGPQGPPGETNPEISTLLVNKTIMKTTDTHVEIKTKMLAAESEIFFPKGEYVINGNTLNNSTGSRVISITKPVRIIGDNATIIYDVGTVIELMHPNIEVRGIRFVARTIGGMVGGEACLRIRRGGARVENCYFGGSSYYHGIFIGNNEGIACDDITIQHNEFQTLGFGILKQGQNAVTGHRLYIHNNKFRDIQRGDAIEINVGGDRGVIISENDIDGVISGTLPNAGFGIGVAGPGPYSSIVESDDVKEFKVFGNIIKNCESEHIHIERASNGKVYDNFITRTDNVNLGETTGVVAWGSKHIEIYNNTISNVRLGIKDDLGVNSGAFVVSSDDNKIFNNTITNTSKGIVAGATGRVTSHIKRNMIRKSERGIEVIGKCVISIKDNEFYDCNIPLYFEYEPVSKTTIAPTEYRFINITGNTAYEKGIATDKGNCYSNVVNFDSFRFEDNNFVLGARTRLPGTFVADVNEPLYYVKGDTLITIGAENAVTRQICVANGYKPKITSPTYYFTAITGNDYVRMHTAAGETKYRLGQVLTLPGIGAGGAAMNVVIERFYIASSEFRIRISELVKTTVATSTAVNLKETAVFVNL